MGALYAQQDYITGDRLGLKFTVSDLPRVHLGSVPVVAFYRSQIIREETDGLSVAAPGYSRSPNEPAT